MPRLVSARKYLDKTEEFDCQLVGTEGKRGEGGGTGCGVLPTVVIVEAWHAADRRGEPSRGHGGPWLLTLARAVGGANAQGVSQSCDDTKCMLPSVVTLALT